MDDLRKPKKLKKLKIGYNILDDEGVKRIIIYDGKEDPNTLIITSVSEIWNKA